MPWWTICRKKAWLAKLFNVAVSFMSYRDDLVTRQAAIGAELAALTSSAAGGKPDASKSGTQHVAYKDGLYRELKEIREELRELDLNATDGNSTAFEIQSSAET